jgi:hypothetical protein
MVGPCAGSYRRGEHHQGRQMREADPADVGSALYYSPDLTWGTACVLPQ